MKTTIIILFSFLSMCAISAQEDSIPTPIEESEILPLALIHKNYGDSIVLRWAPTKTDAWITGMANGYRIQKLEINQDLEAVGDWDTLVTGLILPYSIEKFKQEIAEHTMDVFLAAAAESMYGFQLEHGENLGSGNIFELAEEYSDRFSICLLSADMSQRGATGLGWRFVDKNVEASSKYIYRVYVPGNDSINILMDQTILADVDSFEMTSPFVFDVLEKEGQVDLRLPREKNDAYFTSYFIEKSSNNGESWKKLNEIPFVQPLTDHKIGNKEYIIYRDTGLVNYTPFLYRVRGYTPFGELSQYSEPIEGMGKDRTPTRLPDRFKAAMNENMTMEIDWEYDQEPDDIGGFILARSKRPFDPQTPVHEDQLSPNTRSYIDVSPSTSSNNFYTLYVIDTAENVTYTQSTYGDYVDTIPPSLATGFDYKIDTLGRVELSWNLGPEKDLYGYHVYFSNSKSHYPNNATKSVLQDTIFRDSLDLNSLTETAYYRVTALDFNYNVSGFSEWIEVKKPDLVAPSSPLITGHLSKENGIEIKYVGSSSKDVVKYELHRQEGNGIWKKVSSYSTPNYDPIIDKDVNKGEKYRYRLYAIDDAENKSKLTYDYVARAKLSRILGTIEDFSVYSENKKAIITWKYSGSENDHIKIYRATNGGDFTLIRSVKASNNSMKDYMVRENQKLEYRIALETKNGKVLDMSEVVIL
jgi:hypothetical protein